MITFIVILLLVLILIKNIYNPYLDCFYDYRGEYHIILWYDWGKERKYINIIGNQ